MRFAKRRIAKSVKDFDGIQFYCMFLGHPRSGHSLVGSLLDAHPDSIIAHEFNALKHVERGITRDRLFYRLWRKSKIFTRRGRKWNGYKYKVPNQWHGRYRELKVIGDKKGGSSVGRLRRNPNLLEQLRDVVGVPVKVIHVIRNPFDNIRTLSRYNHRGRLGPTIKGYFSRCSLIHNLRQKIGSKDWVDIYHEDLIAAPERVLNETCQFLGLATTPDYLHDCASIVFKEPRKRRFEIHWKPKHRRKVEENIAKHPYLSRYSFDS